MEVKGSNYWGNVKFVKLCKPSCNYTTVTVSIFNFYKSAPFISILSVSP